MGSSQELVELQCAWLDTSKLKTTKRRSIIEPLVISLDYIRSNTLKGEEAILALAGHLLKYWQRFHPPVATCNEQEVSERVYAYAQRLYQIFEEEWSGSRAHLTHRREGLEDSYYVFLLERRAGRHGGSREGSGRKAELQNPVTLTFKVSGEVAEKIKARAAQEGRSSAELLREMAESL